MKLYLLCIIVLVFLLSICFYCTITVTRISNTTEVFLQDAVHFYQTGNYAESCQQIERLIQFWKHHYNTLGMLLYHSVVEEVTTELYKLRAYASTKDDSEFYSTSAELYALLNQIREMEYPYLKNIL